MKNKRKYQGVNKPKSSIGNEAYLCMPKKRVPKLKVKFQQSKMKKNKETIYKEVCSYCGAESRKCKHTEEECCCFRFIIIPKRSSRKNKEKIFKPNKQHIPVLNINLWYNKNDETPNLELCWNDKDIDKLGLFEASMLIMMKGVKELSEEHKKLLLSFCKTYISHLYYLENEGKSEPLKERRKRIEYLFFG